MASLLHVAGLEKTSNAFRCKLIRICGPLGMNPDYLAAVMSFESAQKFTADVRNPYSGATGLIQFMPSTARNMGTNTDALAALTPEQQLDWVAKYFEPHRGRLRTIQDHYLAVFMPALIGKPLDYVAARAGSKTYSQNSGFDRTGKGYFTVADIVSPILGIVATAKKRPRLPAKCGVPGWLPYAIGGAAIGVIFGVGVGMVMK